MQGIAEFFVYVLAVIGIAFIADFIYQYFKNKRK